MELTSTDGFFVSNKELKETKFKINASAKAFKILSDGLYTNKIKAIIRELSCNAYDAHVDAKTIDKKYNVQLPSFNSPEFSIRDFGTGLSKENIEHIYTTYFESTKTTSNDFIGCLGLGSKTPFCYTDSFIVNSFFNGMMYSYNAYLDEEELPNIALISERETTELNGMEIKFAVKERDHALFLSNAKEVFYWFKEFPNITGTDIKAWNNYYIDKSKSRGNIISGDGWCAMNSGEIRGTFALMGNIAYPINLVDIDSNLKSLIHDSLFVLEMKIGEVEIAASREALSLNKSSKASLKALIEISNKDYLSIIEKNVLATPNWLEACMLFNDYLSMFPYYYSGGDKIEQHFTNIKKDGKFIRRNFELPTSCRKLTIPSYGRNIHTGWSASLDTKDLKNSLFVDNIPKDASDSKLRTFLRNFHNEISAETNRLYLLDGDHQKTVKEKYEIPDIHYYSYSSLPIIKIKKSTTVSSSIRVGKKAEDCYLVYDRQNAKINKGYHASYYDVIDTKKKTTFKKDTKDKIYYIEIDSKYQTKKKDGTGTLDFSNLKSKIDFIIEFANIYEDVIGLTPRQVTSVKDNVNIINIIDAFEEVLKIEINKEELSTILYYEHISRKFSSPQILHNETILTYRPQYKEYVCDFVYDLLEKARAYKVKYRYLNDWRTTFASRSEFAGLILKAEEKANKDYEDYSKRRFEVERTLPDISAFFIEDLWTKTEKKVNLNKFFEKILLEECEKPMPEQLELFKENETEIKSDEQQISEIKETL